MSTKHTIAVFPGDGHGPSVIAAAREVLIAAADTQAISLEFTEFPYSGARYLETGELLPDETLSQLAGFDAILFGGAFHESAEPGLLAREILLKITRGLDQYISLRPVRLFPGVKSYLRNKGPQEIDYYVVRENSGGINGSIGGSMLEGTPTETAQETMVYTRFQVERCLRFAFELARRPDRRGLVTLSGKSSLLPHVNALWNRVFEEMGEREFPSVRRAYSGIDDICMQLVRYPEAFDVIVTGNLFGDILADIGAVSQGGVGYAGVASIHPGRTSMFGPMRAGGEFYDMTSTEPNPMAAISAAAELLRHLGYHDAADRVVDAMMTVTATEVIAEGTMLKRFRTDEVARMVIQRIR